MKETITFYVCKWIWNVFLCNYTAGRCRWNLVDLFQNSNVGIGWHKLSSHLQSGAGHQRVSGSAARKRLNWYSSNLSRSAWSSRMAWTSNGASASGHWGHAMPTLLSEISMRRYWRRQSVQALWEQEDSRGKWQRGWLSRHSGHSSRCSSNSWSWLEGERDRTPVEPLLTPPTHSLVAALFSPTSAAAGRPPPSPLSAPETLDSPASSAARLRSWEQLQSISIYQTPPGKLNCCGTDIETQRKLTYEESIALIISVCIGGFWDFSKHDF